MDGVPAAGGGGGPAPFLLKTYEMVEDSSTDEIVSWGSKMNSFVVWNPPEFARLLLPSYFKHNNFSSFIRQLNTYGFRKIDPEKWEFANEDFVKDQKHLLRNIHRRKPIHSHSQPQGSSVDPERAAFDEEIDRLSREKAALEVNVFNFKQQQSAAKGQLENLTQRVGGMEQRQEKLLTFLEKAIQDRNFVERLARKLESVDFSAFNKKRRKPQDSLSQPVSADSFMDNHSSSGHELGNISHQDFSNKLRLELSPAVSDMNLVSHSAQSSNEDGESLHRRMSEGYVKDAQTTTGGLQFAPETLELSDTGTSFEFGMESSLSCRAGVDKSPGLHSLQQILTSNEEGDGNISCHLNLTLSSSALQVEKSHYSATMPQLGLEISPSPGPSSSASGKEGNIRVSSKNRTSFNEDKTMLSLKEVPTNNQGPAIAQVRVNDVFWEQFLTERPGSSDIEEASSNFRASLSEDQENRRSGLGTPTAEKLKHLTL
ncbi:heat stress transcription factor A-5 [Cornus florida]|uniref:heat stress transcription factor A-5 n=1 Tax=Cornus florida TaxID=4283 RepID=UPI002897E2C2|nr:heat stress transcription factor A-5 [Cornus florida]